MNVLERFRIKEMHEFNDIFTLLISNKTRILNKTFTSRQKIKCKED